MATMTAISTVPTMLTKRRVQQFLWVIPGAAVIYGIGLVLRGPLHNPAALTNPATQQDFLNWINDPNFRSGYLFLTLGLILQLLGFWALYLKLAQGGRAERVALVGLLLSFVGVATNIMIHGVAVLTPNAYPEFANSLLTSSNPPLPVLIGAGLVQLSVIGAIIFSVALWRSRQYPIWLALLYLLHRVAFDFGGAIGFAAEASGVVWLLLSGLAIIFLAAQPDRQASHTRS